MGEGLGLLPNRALSASVGRSLLKNDHLVGIPNLLGAFSSANWHRSGDNPNKFGTPVLRSGGPSHTKTFFNGVRETLGER
jgi:hypothetical protein